MSSRYVITSYSIHYTKLYDLAIIIERVLYFRSIKTDEDKLFQRVKASVEKGHFDEALSICDNNESPLSALIKVGIERNNFV